MLGTLIGPADSVAEEALLSLGVRSSSQCVAGAEQHLFDSNYVAPFSASAVWAVCWCVEDMVPCPVHELLSLASCVVLLLKDSSLCFTGL